MRLNFRLTFIKELTPLGDTYEARGERAPAYIIHKSRRDGSYYVHFATGDGALRLGVSKSLLLATHIAQHYENYGKLRLPIKVNDWRIN